MVSTPIGYLGSGQGGGVEQNLLNLASTLQARGHRLVIVAPAGSQASVPVLEVSGMAPPLAQHQTELVVTVPSVLTAMWAVVCAQAPEFDLIVNWAYDWLPFYLTPFFAVPVLHIVSMGALQPELSLAIASVQSRYPHSIAMHSRAQAATFAGVLTAPEILPCGIDPARYTFVAEPGEALAWVGRIAPEKGLEDVAALAEQIQQPIAIYGHCQDPAYWQQIQAFYPTAPLDYRGFLGTVELQAALGQARALIMTPKWIEAFGMVAIEALACGVPVIAYRRGGPVEIVSDGVTGYLVEPDSVAGLVAAIAKLDALDRSQCRHSVGQHFSLERMADRFEIWAQRQLSRHCPA